MCGICAALERDRKNELLASGSSDLVKPPYRLLSHGEKMQEGDEYTPDGGTTWKPLAPAELIGQPWMRGELNPVRRMVA
jgi:hypothetical protein